MRTYFVRKIRQLEDLLKMTKEENDKTIDFLMSIMTAEQREQYRDYLTDRREELNQEWAVVE